MWCGAGSSLRGMRFGDAKLVGGMWDGKIVPVPLKLDGEPYSPMSWPVTEIPWCPSLVYELDGRNSAGLWVFKYVRADYDGS